MAKQPTINKNGLQLLQELLGLGPADLSDPLGIHDAVLIAIDFEQLGNIRQDDSLNLDSQVGLAILNVRDIMSLNPSEIISTFQFASGSPGYCERTSKKFLFGNCTSIKQKDMLNSIKSLIPGSRSISLSATISGMIYRPYRHSNSTFRA
jgi:hypothetical protein